MWNPFKDSKKSPETRRNRVHEIANNLRDNNQSHEIPDAIISLNPAELTKKENEARFHLIGLFASHQKQHEEAIVWFTQGLKHVPNSQLMQYSLGQEYIFMRESKKAFELFDRCQYPNLPAEYILKMSKYAYIYDQYERGIAYVTQFFQHYWNLKILDDQFLAMRGLPLFNVVWDHLAVHCILSKTNNILIDYTAKVKSQCQDYDFEYLDAQLKAYVEDDSYELLEIISARLDQPTEHTFNTEYNRTKLICLNLLHFNTYEEGIELLHSVVEPQLQDIVLLANAALGDRFDMREQEEKSIQQFLLHQPLLFGPEIALPFGFIPYQEKLKKIIR